MTKELKMSDAFVLPVSNCKGDLFHSKNPLYETRFCKFFNMNQAQAATYTAHAINTHDQHIERIKELERALDDMQINAEFLWKALDDISTVGDMFKPEINAYFEYVESRCEERSKVANSDGYTLTFADVKE